MTKENTTTLTGVAVAVVALSRFIATNNPKLGSFLGTAIENAANSGIKPEDLELLRTIAKAATLG